MDNEFKKTLEPDSSGNKKSLRVYLINPPIDNPWATKEDYLNDQKRINTAQRWTIAAAMSAIITALCTIALTYSELSQTTQAQEKTLESPSQPLKTESTTQKSGQK